MIYVKHGKMAVKKFVPQKYPIIGELCGTVEMKPIKL